MIATLFAGENSESAQFARMNEGTYVGGHDEYGKRSGFGTWAYYNYLYAGQWENDLPHGEGTLYSVSDQGEHIAHGEWQDGVAVGEVELVDIRRDFSGPERFFHYRKNAQAMPLNARGLFLRNYFDGLIPPGPGMELPAFVTPWYLYEKYPSGKLEYSPLEKIENTGMGKTPGNLANARLGGMQMAVLGDWIVLCVSQNDLRAGNTVHTLYKMRADGTQMTKIHEHDKNASGHWSPALQVIGDWLFVGEDWPGAVPPYKMRAEDAALTPDVGGYPPGLVVDEWVYQLSGGNTGASVYRYRTDNSGYTYLGHSEQKEVEVLDGVEWTFAYDYDSKVLFADKDWVYVHFRGTKTGKTPDGQKNESVADIVKFRNDESGEIEAHSLLSQGNAFVAFPQIVGGRLYYTEQRYSKNKAEPTVVFCVDLDFAQAPVAVVPGSKGHYINALHVTDDFLYYVDANDWGQGAKSSIVKANLDGSNPVVLADGLVGVNSLLIAGDWMMFSDNEGIDCLMRLDGSDLHRLKDALPTDTE